MEVSARFVLGCHASIYSSCLCVLELLKVKMDVFNYRIVDEYYTTEIDIDALKTAWKNFESQYRISNIFTNRIGVAVFDGINNLTSCLNGNQYKGVEIIQTDTNEELVFATLSNLKKLSFSADLQDKWQEEFKNFKLGENNYPRILALGNIFSGMQPTSTMLDAMPNVYFDKYDDY